MRLPVAIWVLSVVCLAIAVTEWFDACELSVREFWLAFPPGVGAFGASWADVPKETAGERAARVRRNQENLANERLATRVSRVSATVSLFGASYLVWKARKAPRRQRLPSALLALGALGILLATAIL